MGRPKRARRRKKRLPREPRVLSVARCSVEARELARATGLDILEIENLLRAGRTREDLLALTRGNR